MHARAGKVHEAQVRVLIVNMLHTSEFSTTETIAQFLVQTIAAEHLNALSHCQDLTKVKRHDTDAITHHENLAHWLAIGKHLIGVAVNPVRLGNDCATPILCLRRWGRILGPGLGLDIHVTVDTLLLCIISLFAIPLRLTKEKVANSSNHPLDSLENQAKDLNPHIKYG
jgi:hypothetical protein